MTTPEGAKSESWQGIERQGADRQENMKRAALREAVICAAVLLALIYSSYMLTPAATRLLILRGILLLMAVFEVVIGILQGFATKRFMGSYGWAQHPQPYFGFVQDLGLYELGLGLAFLSAALDPLRSNVVIQVGIVIYMLHGAVHLSR